MKELLSSVAISNLWTMRAASKVNPINAIGAPYTMPADPRTRALRARLLLEECLETISALGFHVASSGMIASIDDAKLVPHKNDLDLMAVVDGCIDVNYVAIGTLVALGVPDLPHAEEVNRANSSKFPGGVATVNESGKFQKPPDWQPPDHLSLSVRLMQEVDLRKLAEEL